MYANSVQLEVALFKKTPEEFSSNNLSLTRLYGPYLARDIFGKNALWLHNSLYTYQHKDSFVSSLCNKNMVPIGRLHPYMF